MRDLSNVRIFVKMLMCVTEIDMELSESDLMSRGERKKEFVSKS